MSWTGRRVLVTGAGGFIGSHLSERLVRAGATTRALVHYRGNGSWGWLDASPDKDAIEVLAGDVRDRDCLARAMEEVDVVFHLAALIAIPYSYQAPASYVQTNVEGTLNVLQAARDTGVGRVVHTSTSEVYGTARYVPIDEAHPVQAQSPYAASKAGADQLAEAFFHSFDLPIVTVRPFNTYGPRQSARAVIPTIITQCLSGDAVRLGHLHPTRDFNYVGNTVDGFLKAGEAEGAIGQTINLGSGREVGIGQLAEIIMELIGKTVAIEQEEERLRPEQSEVERLLADTSLARTLLDWQPSVSLEDGLRMTIAWLQEHRDRYRPGVYAV